MFVIPYVEKYFENYNDYNVGDIIEYSNNGVDRWVVVDKGSGSSLVLIPETPIELVIESADDNIIEKAYQIRDSFNNAGVYSYGFYDNDFRTGDNNQPNLISNFLNQQTEKIWFYRSYLCPLVIDDSIYSGRCGGITYFENGEFGYENNTLIYTNIDPKTLGYRPVVTLKVKNEVQDKDKQEISNKLQVGDNVKYEAKGYKNWKVLSVDNDLNTVDIISGGIVKNITLSGKEDWENFEDIIQREVDEYKNGDQAKEATTVTSKDLKTLKEIDKSILSSYWLLSKTTNNFGEASFGGKYADKVIFSIGTIKLYKNDNFEMYLKNITIYAELKGNQDVVNHYKNSPNDLLIGNSNINDINLSSYTAGLRPIITLKLDSVETLPDEETKKIEESTEKQEKVFIKEQESKNKNYKGPSKVDNSTSSTGNNEVKTNDNDNTKDNITDNNTSNVEKIVYKDKPFYKYGFIIALILCLIEPVITILIYKKIKER